MYTAFAIAASIGLAIFLIWWFTLRRPPAGGVIAAAETAGRRDESPAIEALVEAALPRGGTLTGSTEPSSWQSSV